MQDRIKKVREALESEVVFREQCRNDDPRIEECPDWNKVDKLSEQALKDEEMPEEKIEYRTVEGHPIVRDGEYETRGGKKAVILGAVLTGGNKGVVGYLDDGDWNPIGHWGAEVQGLIGHLPCDDDLMRPWVDKEEQALQTEEKDDA